MMAAANFMFFGRLLQFAIAAGGEQGLERIWGVLSVEISIAMAQTGMSRLTEVSTPLPR
ncbi:MAG: alpha-hydroxy-acid oxidizing protein, partial [Sulfitobacter sp.]